MILLQRLEHLLGGFRRIDPRGNTFQLGLILVQVVIPNLQQAVQRYFDHVLVEELLLIEFRTEPIVALGEGQQLALHPRFVTLELGDDVVIGRLELPQELRVGDVFEGFRYVFLKETDDPRHLLDRNFAIYARRILQVEPRHRKIGGDKLLARDD